MRWFQIFDLFFLNSFHIVRFKGVNSIIFSSHTLINLHRFINSIYSLKYDSNIISDRRMVYFMSCYQDTKLIKWLPYIIILGYHQHMLGFSLRQEILYSLINNQIGKSTSCWDITIFNMMLWIWSELLYD